VLAEDLYQRFDELQLVQPFDRSLAAKKQQMDTAMAAFENLVSYEVGDVTAAATFYMAEIYYDFSRSLIESERPAGLDAAELADYELVIEEEAFPFEERAIAVHEANLELLATGLFNGWVEQSLDRLAILMPGRYAKQELSSGFIDSIDTYAYLSPGLRQIDIGEEEDVETSAPENASPSIEVGSSGEAAEPDLPTDAVAAGGHGAPAP
jgi:hypothetical protein